MSLASALLTPFAKMKRNMRSFWVEPVQNLLASMGHTLAPLKTSLAPLLAPVTSRREVLKRYSAGIVSGVIARRIRLGRTAKQATDNRHLQKITSNIDIEARSSRREFLHTMFGTKNISDLAKMSRPELPRVSSGLPFSLHNIATGNAVTRRLPKLNIQHSSPIRSRAMRYRG
jgi:hypothetical protein